MCQIGCNLENAMKRIIGAFILVFLLSACSSASAKRPGLTQLVYPSSTFQPSPSTTAPPGRIYTTAAPNPTDLFITQVMGQKYAARTAYAALPTITPTPTIPPDSVPCQPGDLQVTLHSTGATQHIVLEVGLTNIGKAPCFIPAWPAVQLLDRSGSPIAVTYDYVFFDKNPSNLPPTQESNPGEPVLYGLAVNQNTVLLLPWGNWCGAPVEGGVIIKIQLLGANNFLDVSTDITNGGYCDDPGAPSTVDVVGFGY